VQERGEKERERKGRAIGERGEGVKEGERGKDNMHIFKISPPSQSKDAFLLLLEKQFCFTPSWRRGLLVICCRKLLAVKPQRRHCNFSIHQRKATE